MRGHTPRRAFVAGMLAAPFAPRSGLARPAELSQAGGTGGFSAFVAFVAEREVGLAILANRHHPVQHRLGLAKRLREAMEA